METGETLFAEFHRTVRSGPAIGIPGTKWYDGSGRDGKHYWLTPPDLYARLDFEFHFDFDPCPYPKPNNFDGLLCEWGQRNYVNPPFGTIIHNGKKKGPTAWMRKAILEQQKGKLSVVVYPIDKWIFMMLQAIGISEIRNLGECAVVRDRGWITRQRNGTTYCRIYS